MISWVMDGKQILEGPKNARTRGRTTDDKSSELTILSQLCTIIWLRHVSHDCFWKHFDFHKNMQRTVDAMMFGQCDVGRGMVDLRW
jgi:hypothetical protein